MRLWITAVCASLAAACATPADTGSPPPSSAPERMTPSPSRQPPAAPRSGRFTPDAELFICPRIRVANAPASDADRRIVGYKPFVAVDGVVVLALAPVNGACLSSGFGPRGRGMHRGIDLNQNPPTTIYAAGEGRVVEAGYRDDFGNQVVIDHGDGVFTRYAHLADLQVAAGEAVGFGAPLGRMGASGAYSVAVHLHYEILTGDYDTPAASFGLTAADPFSLPRIDPPETPEVSSVLSADRNER